MKVVEEFLTQRSVARAVPSARKWNIVGKRLWHVVTAPFAPEVCHLNDEETVLVFTTPKRDIP